MRKHNILCYFSFPLTISRVYAGQRSDCGKQTAVFHNPLTDRIDKRRENLVERLVVEHAVAEAFELGVPDLVAEFLAHALRVGRALDAAGAIAARALEALFHSGDYLLIGVVGDGHVGSFPHSLFAPIISTETLN